MTAPLTSYVNYSLAWRNDLRHILLTEPHEEGMFTSHHNEGEPKMSISSQRLTERTAQAYSNLVTLYDTCSRFRNGHTALERFEALAAYHAALDMYALFTSQDPEAVNDQISESRHG